MKGCDYAYGWSPGFGADLADAGYQFAIRYLSGGGAKDLTAKERDDLHSAGLLIGLVWETTADRMNDGTAAGADDGKAAAAQANGLGAPDGTCLYFAHDQDGWTDRAAAYLRAAALAAHGAGYQAGLYGGLAAIQAAALIAPCDRLWQTYAWSGGKKALGLDLYQSGGTTVAGVRIDVDTSYTDAGLWKGGDVALDRKDDLDTLQLMLGDLGLRTADNQARQFEQLDGVSDWADKRQTIPENADRADVLKRLQLMEAATGQQGTTFVLAEGTVFEVGATSDGKVTLTVVTVP